MEGNTLVGEKILVLPELTERSEGLGSNEVLECLLQSTITVYVVDAFRRGSRSSRPENHRTCSKIEALIAKPLEGSIDNRGIIYENHEEAGSILIATFTLARSLGT